MDWLQLSSLAALAGFSLVGSIGDIRTRIIPNTLCGAAMVTGLAFAFAMGGGDELLASALHVLAALAGGMALFALRFIGGGDAKFYAALASWFPLSWGIFYLTAVSMAGLLLLVAMLIVSRGRKASSSARNREGNFKKLPYGVAIGVGATAAYWSSNFML